MNAFNCRDWSEKKPFWSLRETSRSFWGTSLRKFRDYDRFWANFEYLNDKFSRVSLEKLRDRSIRLLKRNLYGVLGEASNKDECFCIWKKKTICFSHKLLIIISRFLRQISDTSRENPPGILMKIMKTFLASPPDYFCAVPSNVIYFLFNQETHSTIESKRGENISLLHRSLWEVTREISESSRNMLSIMIREILRSFWAKLVDLFLWKAWGFWENTHCFAKNFQGISRRSTHI